LLLLASLEERSTYGELNCFLEVEDEDDLKEDVLADKATKNGFTLFRETMAGQEVEIFPYF